MHWRFDPLFSVAVYHSKYKNPDPDTGESPPQAPDFELEPSESAARRFKSLGWLFKRTGGGWTVCGEKTFAADGSTRLRCLPAKGEGFSFFLRLRNPALFNETKPFVLEFKPEIVPNPNLPACSGRARILYFDNLHPTPINIPGAENAYWLTPAATGLEQFGSRGPIPFEFSNAGATKVVATAFAPGAAAQTFPLDPKTHAVIIDLPENGYQLVHQPSNRSEILFLTAEIPPPDTLGVLRIFEHPGGNGWEPQRRYRILFEQA